ncbi:MAG: MBL fold metallo-hydrolase [Patescibacteria group bacterium]
MPTIKWTIWRWWLLLILALFVSALWLTVWSKWPSQYLTVSYLDVGQGDAILIDTPHHNQLLIDTGPNRKILSSLASVLPFFDRSLNVVLITHQDLDHRGGLSDLIKNYAVDYEVAADKNVALPGTPFVAIARGTKIDLGDGIIFEVLSSGAGELLPSNDGSVAGILSAGQKKFLFTADLPSSRERYLVNQFGVNLKADVLKVSHHGSKGSSDSEFLQTVQPTYAVISVGANNRYGHPTTEALDRIKSAGAEILRTDQLGTIVFETDGQSLIRK